MSLSRNRFEAYIMVDWSANSVPKKGKDSIWICWGDQTGALETENPPTRDLAMEHIRALIQQCVEKGQRVLVGFDFAFGHPAGFSSPVWGKPEDKPWKRTWQYLLNEVKGDNQADGNFDRFKFAARLNENISGNSQGGPFWGRPTTGNSISKTRPDPFRWKKFRITEERIEGVQETWKLFAPGSVGSQTLLGIPRVADLRFKKFESKSAVWPFETGFSTGEKEILFAEIWPGIVEDEVGKDFGDIVRDEKQVKAMVNWCGRQDRLGELKPMFNWPGGNNQVQAIEEEGWILGPR